MHEEARYVRQRSALLRRWSRMSVAEGRALIRESDRLLERSTLAMAAADRLRSIETSRAGAAPARGVDRE